MDAGNELTIVNVEELPSRAWILDLSVAAEPEPAAADSEVERLRAELKTARKKAEAEAKVRGEAETARGVAEVSAARCLSTRPATCVP